MSPRGENSEHNASYQIRFKRDSLGTPYYLPPRQGSLPESLGVVGHLAPTRAPHHPASPRATTFLGPHQVMARRTEEWRGHTICSGTGRGGVVEGPLWVPGPVTYKLSGREGSRWFAASDQAEKNRSVKKVLLEKEGHYANSNTRFL
jgi:hypothetical protein